MKPQNDYIGLMAAGIVILAVVITYMVFEEKRGCNFLIDGAYDLRCEVSK